MNDHPVRRRPLIAAGLASLAALAARPLRAQQPGPYPSGPVRIIVPYPAGGATDAQARIVAAHLQQAWGQTVIVDNKPGASGVTGNDMVVKAPPDGYTVLLAITALVQQPPLMKLPYDPLRDLAPVAEVSRVNSALVVPADSPAHTYKEFIAMVKAAPNKTNYGSYGNGTSSHIQGSLLNLQAGLDMQHVPYKGAAPLLNDLMGGQLNAAFVDISTASPHLKGGKFRAIAVTGTARNRLLPDVPTFKELGLHSFEPYGWFGFFMPAATPAPTVQKFSAEVGRGLRLPEVAAKIDLLGVMPVGNKPEEFGRTVRDDAELYARIIRDTKITLE